MHKLSLTEQSQALSTGTLSCEELTQHYLKRIHLLNQRYNCFITVTEHAALQQAKEADRRRRANSKQVTPLTGIPIAHKDNLLTASFKTSCASRMLDNFYAPFESTVSQLLSDAGAVMLGKTNMDEFAMGSSNETSYYGTVKNPWDDTRVPGGSSGGSACAVAARLASACTGSDTGGSIRQPAALCGVSGLKPTYGRLSRWGLVAFASSLDQIGPIAQTADDLALLMNTMAKKDNKDSTNSNHPVPDYCKTLTDSIQGKRIGLISQWLKSCDPQVADAVQKAAKLFSSMGAIISEIDLKHAAQDAISAYYVLASAEAASNLARFDGIRYGYRCKNPKDIEDLYCRSRSEGFGPEVKRRIMVGNYTLSTGYYDAYYIKAQKVRRLVKNEFEHTFKSIDLILAPTTPTTAFHLGDKIENPAEMYQSDIFTVGVNLAGLPAISIPAGFVSQLPVGMQLIGPYFSEPLLLNVASRYQKETNWHQQLPKDLDI